MSNDKQLDIILSETFGLDHPVHWVDVPSARRWTLPGEPGEHTGARLAAVEARLADLEERARLLESGQDAGAVK